MKEGITIFPGMQVSQPNTQYVNTIDGITTKWITFTNGDRYTPQQVAHNLKCGKWKEIQYINKEP